jgi:hypothetical protein
MTSPLDSTVAGTPPISAAASEVFEAAIVDHVGPGTRIPGVIAPSVGDVLMADEPSALDLVVRRRDDGSEIVRTPADLGSPVALLTTAERDLAEMSVEEFLAEWEMP